MNFNFDYGRIDLARPVTRPVDEDAPLYAAVGGRAASLSNNECVFQSDRGGVLEVMTHQVLQAMDQTREFRSLDEHIARVISVIPGMAGQGEAVQRVLGYLVQRKLLISDGDFLDSLKTDGPTSGPALDTLVLRASDRPAQIERLLSVLRVQASRHRRRDRIVLLDDSRLATAVQSHRRALVDHGNALGVAVNHIDADQSRAIGERLARSVPQVRELLPNLLQLGQGSGFSGGRGYNLAMLLNAGSQFGLLDDDYVPEFRRSDGAQSGLDLNPWTRWTNRFPDDPAQALVQGEELAGDGFALQSGMVGNTLGHLFARQPDLLPTRQQLRGQTLSQLAHLRSDARIVSTYTGVRGASFTSDNVWLYLQDEQSRAEFWRSRESYLRHTNAEAVVSTFQRLVARPHGTFTPFVVDNTQLMPCTAASGRGEDALFSVASHYLYPDSLTLHLPISIGHVQEGRRPRVERGIQAMTPGINRFLREWIRKQARPAHSADAEGRLQFLAAQLEDLASAPSSDRIAMLAEYLRYVRADLIERIQQQIVAAPDAPVYWLADARAIVEANGRALLENDVPRLDDWPIDIDAKGCAERFRGACLELAAAWRVWPALWTAAREMGDRLLSGR